MSNYRIFTIRIIACAIAILLASCTNTSPEPTSSVYPTAAQTTTEPSDEQVDESGGAPSAEPSSRVSLPPAPADQFFIGERSYTPRSTIAYASEEHDLSRLADMNKLQTLTLTISEAAEFDFSLITGLPSLTTLELVITGSSNVNLSVLENMPLASLTVRLVGDAEGLVLPLSDTLEQITVEPSDGITRLDFSGYSSLDYLVVDGVSTMDAIKVSDCPVLNDVSVTVDDTLGLLSVSGSPTLHSISLMGDGVVESVETSTPYLMVLQCGEVGDVICSGYAEDGNINLYSSVTSVVYPVDNLSIKAYGDVDLDAFVACESLRKIVIDDQFSLDLAALPSFSLLEEIELKICEQDSLEVSSESELALTSSKLGADGKRTYLSINTAEELGLSTDYNNVYYPDAFAWLDTPLDEEQLGHLIAYCERGGLVQLSIRNQ